MANYSYLYLPAVLPTAKFRVLLRQVVSEWFAGAMVVGRGRSVEDGMLWVVSAPNTAVYDVGRANHMVMTPGEDFGFPVELQCEGFRSVVALRHSPDWKQNWAQGCVSELLSERLGVGLYYDSTNKTYPPGTRDHRDGRAVLYAHRFWNVPRDLSTVLGRTQKWVKARWPQVARPSLPPR